MELRKLLPPFISGLVVAAIGWFGAPYVRSKMDGTPLNGVEGILGFWKGVVIRPIPAWVAVAIVILALAAALAWYRWKMSSREADLRIVVLPTPGPRWNIGAFGATPYMSFSFHARLAHRETFSLEIVKAYLVGTTCVAPFTSLVVAGPNDPPTMVHFGVRPILAEDGESVTRRVVLVDQFGNKHLTEKVRFEASSQPARSFGPALIGREGTTYAASGVDIASGSPLLVMAATAARSAQQGEQLRCWFCGGALAMEDLHAASAVPAHRRCVK
jgi:hypothetical protein